MKERSDDVVRIGHSSKDENGKISGGAAGDQNEKEVCVRNWYAGGWDFVARFKDKTLAEKAAKACEDACSNSCIGYDQGSRNSLRQEAAQVGWDLKKIARPCECDCSSFMGVCIEAAGIKLPADNGPTTRTLRKVLEATGCFEILTAGKYLTSEKWLKRGDILCNEGSHTVMAVSGGEYAESASVSYSGTATMYYNVRLPLLTRGSTGPAVVALQTLLKARGYDVGGFGLKGDGIDGDFGAATQGALEAFQKDMNIKADGKCGSQSWTALLTA